MSDLGAVGPGMSDAGWSAELIDALKDGFPDSCRKLRPVHTFGVGASGFFEASEVAAKYCAAEHFQSQGDRVPVIVRFSNGSGSREQHDGWSDVRGMAVRFQLASGATTDLIGMTLSAFFAPRLGPFFCFSNATKPVKVARASPWRKLRDMLQLIPPPPDPYPGQTTSSTPGAIGFAERNDYARLPVLLGGWFGAPTSYARASYHAVHTFVVRAPDGVRRWVRFTWRPVAGVLNTDPSAPPLDRYLEQELRDRIAKGTVRFLLMMSIGEGGDDFNNPARPWPSNRVRILMGTLTINSILADQKAECEPLSFNPCHLVDGIETSDDPILLARRGAYQLSAEWRAAARAVSES